MRKQYPRRKPLRKPLRIMGFVLRSPSAHGRPAPVSPDAAPRAALCVDEAGAAHPSAVLEAPLFDGALLNFGGQAAGLCAESAALLHDLDGGAAEAEGVDEGL